MNSKVLALRAISSVVARQAVLLVAWVGVAIGVLLFALVWLLATQLSTCWWRLLVIFVPLCLLFTLGLIIARFGIRRLYPYKLDKNQRQLLSNFANKVQALAATRGIGWSAFALMSVRDLVFKRDLSTLKNLLSDATSLKKDLEEIEQHITS